MTTWLFKHRFNYIDALTLVVAAVAIHDGEWLGALATAVVGAALSVLVEGRGQK